MSQLDQAVEDINELQLIVYRRNVQFYYIVEVFLALVISDAQRPCHIHTLRWLKRSFVDASTLHKCYTYICTYSSLLQMVQAGRTDQRCSGMMPSEG